MRVDRIVHASIDALTDAAGAIVCDRLPNENYARDNRCYAGSRDDCDICHYIN